MKRFILLVFSAGLLLMFFCKSPAFTEDSLIKKEQQL